MTTAPPGPPVDARTAAATAEAARALLDALDAEQRDQLRSRLDDRDRRRWTYVDGRHPGLVLGDLDARRHELALALLASAGDDRDGGSGVVRGAVELERVRQGLAAEHAAAGTPLDPPSLEGRDDPDPYALRLEGEPGSAAWGWRVSGHHLAVHVAVVDERVHVTPHFVGAQPAVVPRGPRAGWRLLGPEEDLARDVLAALDADRLALARPSGTAPADVLTGTDPVADPGVLPRGLAHRDMPPAAQRSLELLVQRYLRRAPAAYAAACWEEVLADGLGGVELTWLGSLVRGEGHYYAVRAPSLLLELDDTQHGADHVHTVWRHLRDDFGGDLLREHLRARH
ncbi:DUF3500 domain-containing protein [uncultured Pseudokineococcus sp.]|uniref:DUF3500 domain-containing protein n=1 Tax=uncultured Pseudokineococcus sp. TaxID=1642928 RepID=UPI002617FF6E|nr:DUF3500 domain-containing protein [uncultured Pseudokineococcus sp.]